MEQTHGRSYGRVKKIIAAGKMDKEELLEKVDLLFMGDGLTKADYEEITAEINSVQ